MYNTLMSPNNTSIPRSSRTEIGIVCLLILLFIAKNSLIAFFGPPWYGEDELSHFGYIEALGRTHHWYSFKDNFTSEESFQAWEHFQQMGDKKQAIQDIQNNQFQSLRQAVSTHPNSTAYQPPLYYFLMAKLYQTLPSLNVLSLLYLFRVINVLLGAGTLIVAYLLARSLIQGSTSRLVFMSFLVFEPLYSFLTATVTSQILIIFLATLLLTLLYYSWQYRWAPLLTLSLDITLILGLLTHQMFLLFIPVIVVALLFDFFRRNITLASFLTILAIFTISGIPLIPQYLTRHQDTQYTIAAPEQPHPWNFPNYLLTQLPRIKTEYFTGFWIQVRGNIPYTAPEPLVNTTRFFTLITLIGLIVGLSHRSLDQPRSRWYLLTFISLILLILAHLIIDYLQYHLNAQEYFKGRYLFLLLIPLASLYTFGWKSLLGSNRWYTAASLSLVSYLLIFNFSAIIWLITQTAL